MKTHVVFVGQVAEHLPELRGVGGAVVRRRLHAGENHVMSRAFARVMISLRLRFICATGSPRRPSFAPSSITSTSTSPSSDQSSRLKPPADVSPETPGVDHLVPVAFSVQARLDERRHRLFARQAESRGQAVA